MGRIILSMFAAIVMLTACSAGKDIEAAQNEVVKFHRLLDSGRFTEIYAGTGPEIRQDLTAAEWETMLASVHDRFGTVAKADATGWNVNYGTDGDTVELVYDTQFTRGTLQETFVYRMADSKATLAGYQFKSK